MKEIYLLIKHSNKIETDNVSILKASYDLKKIIKDYTSLTNLYKKKYELIEETITYTKYSNKENTYLIEVYIEKLNIE